MKYEQSDYVARVTSASPVQLVVITYELAIEHISDAIHHHSEVQDFRFHLKKAMDFLGSLIDSLDMQYEISRNLMPLYIYVNKLLIQGKNTDTIEPLYVSQKILSSLLNSWEEVAKNEVNSDPVMENSQQVYAGLTYGKGLLNEYIPEDKNRGFTV